MKSKDVKIGGEYLAKVSGTIARVRIESESIYGGWNARNTKTGRAVRIRTAARLRHDCGVRIPRGDGRVMEYLNDQAVAMFRLRELKAEGVLYKLYSEGLGKYRVEYEQAA